MPDIESLTALASVLGRLEKTIERSFEEYNKRLTWLEEREIRRDERERAEGRMKKEMERARLDQEDRDARAEQEQMDRRVLSISGWQLWAGVLTVLVALVSVGVGLAQLFH